MSALCQKQTYAAQQKTAYSITFGELAGFPFRVDVHILRHACGYVLANAG
jgi:hypothetical protein